MWTHGALLAAIDDRRALLSRLNHPSGALAGLSKQCLDASPLLATVRRTAGVYPILFPIWIALLSSEDSAPANLRPGLSEWSFFLLLRRSQIAGHGPRFSEVSTPPNSSNFQAVRTGKSGSVILTSALRKHES